MQTKSLQMKRALRAALLVLLLSVVGMGKGYAQNSQNYDFSAVCSTGQTLYYRYIEATNDVRLVCPNYHYPGHYNWDGYDKPTGDLVIPESVNYNGITYSVTTISMCTFSDCNGLTSITIPNSVTTIEYQAFFGCSGLTSITIPNSVIFLDRDAFDETGWYVQQPDGILYLDNCCLGYKGGTQIGELYLQEGTRLICDRAFCVDGAGFITGSLTIPNSVTSIGHYAFADCTGFNGNLTIPNSVEYIGSGAFSDCSGLTGSLTIPNSVTSIGHYAFAGCTGFNGNLTLGNSLTTIGDHAFDGLNGFTGNLMIPNSVTTIGNYAFEGCTGFNGNLTLGNSLTTIGDHAFDGLNGFTGNLMIPNSMTTIGNHAFAGCNGFTGGLTIPNSVTTIGDKAFQGCDGFNGNLTIGNSVTTIGNDAFLGCKGFKTINIGDSVEAIEDEMFVGLENLTSISIGKSVKYIGEKAFGENPRLNVVYYNVEKLESAYYNVFDNCPNLTTIHIGPDVQEIGSNIFKGCNTVHFVVALGPTPAVLDAGAFSDIVDNSVLMVSCGKRVAYYSVWNMFPFNNIIEDCNEYLISIGVNGTGGNVTSSVTNGQMGQTIIITITPNPGMMLSSISVVNANDPTQIIPITPMGKSASNYSFVMPPFEVVVMATFKTSGTSVEENAVVSVPASVYPNPTTGLVKVEAENLKQITISNMLGQQIYNGKATGNEFEYDFGRHGKGLYLIRIETTNGVAVKKVSVR